MGMRHDKIIARMVIKTDNLEAIKPFLKELYVPPVDSHKGQNGKVLMSGIDESVQRPCYEWFVKTVSNLRSFIESDNLSVPTFRR